jgi:two-component system NtrC family sensor kinase
LSEPVAVPGPVEAELAAQLREQRAIINGALDGIVVIDDTGIVREFNRAAEDMFGYSRSEALGTPIVELIIPDLHRDRHTAGFQGYVNGTATAQMIGRRIETEARRKDGEIFHVELTIIEMTGTDRRVFAGYLRDLTERREMEAQVARQRESISHNEKLGSMGALLANVAHELNNPLSVVIGRADLLREQPLDDAVKHHTDRIHAAANRCARIVHTFLAAVRQKPPVSRTFPAARPLISSVDLIEHAYQSEGVELRVDIADNLPDLFGDDGQIEQVLANLLTNAQQALSAQQAPKVVEVSVNCTGDAGNVVFRVVDNGPGVPEELRSRVFEPFFTTKSAGSGTGVGLAIAHNIVTAHGGVLSLCGPGQVEGAAFELSLPVGGPSRDFSSSDEVPLDAADLQGLQVLVVDDEEEVAQMLAELVRGQGMLADVATGGGEALERMQASAYDVVLSDLRMPDMGGPRLVSQATQRWPGVERCFGFVTGDSLSATAAEFLAESGSPVIEKPVTAEALLSLVLKVRARAAE